MHRVDFVLMIDLLISCLKNPFLANWFYVPKGFAMVCTERDRINLLARIRAVHLVVYVNGAFCFLRGSRRFQLG